MVIFLGWILIWPTPPPDKCPGTSMISTTRVNISTKYILEEKNLYEINWNLLFFDKIHVFFCFFFNKDKAKILENSEIFLKNSKTKLFHGVYQWDEKYTRVQQPRRIFVQNCQHWPWVASTDITGAGSHWSGNIYFSLLKLNLDAEIKDIIDCYE